MLALALAAGISVNAADTLRNFNPRVTAPIALQFPATAPGYYTGHNSYGDEEWGEKYYVNGSRQVAGMLAWHTGTAGTTTHQSFYKLYSAGPDGMPATTLATRNVSSTSINVTGAQSYISLPAATTVKDSFFISFGMQDYSHDDPGTKTIAIMHSPDGARSFTDTLKRGRNVVRWHGHGAAKWADFFQDNYTRVRIHLALFPVLARSTSVGEYQFTDGFRIYSPYPSPASNQLNIRIESPRPSELRCTILSMSGATIDNWQSNAGSGSQTISRDISALPAGTYIMLVQTPGGQSAEQFVKR